MAGIDEPRADAAGPFLQAVKELFETQQFSDLTVKCNDREWKLHKSVLCCRSKYFANACSGKFKEATENTITLHDDDPPVVDAMLRYLYQFDYDAEAGARESKAEPIIFNVWVHILADKYDIIGLLEVAETKFASLCKVRWATAPYAEAVREVYTAAADRSGALRRTILEICSLHVTELHNEDLGTSFREIVRSTPAFALELCVKVASKAKDIGFNDAVKYCCPNVRCRMAFVTARLGNSGYGRRSHPCPFCGCVFSTHEWEHCENKEDPLYMIGTGMWPKGV